MIMEGGVERKVYAKGVLLQVVTQWFDSCVLEYVCQWHQLPQCILACWRWSRHPIHGGG